MRRLVLMLKCLVYVIAFCIATLVAARLTFDPDQLTPEVESLLSAHTGAEVEISKMELTGVMGLTVSSVQVSFPMSPEREAEWKEFRAYMKMKRLAKRGEAEEPEPMLAPKPALKLCAQNAALIFSMSDVINVLLYQELTGAFEGKLFECEAPSGPLDESTPQRLYVEFKTALSEPLPELREVGKPARHKRGQRDIQFRASLSPLTLKYNELLVEYLPMPIEGELSLEADGVISFGKRGKLLLRKSSGQLQLNIEQLVTESASVNMFDMPRLPLGQLTARLELEQGRLLLKEFKTTSAQLESAVTGNLKLSGVLARTQANLHIGAKISSSFIKKQPDIKVLVSMGPARKFIKRQSGGDYKVGVQLNGRVSQPRFTPAVQSPYGADGRRANRSKSRRNDRYGRNKDQRAQSAKRDKNKSATRGGRAKRSKSRIKANNKNSAAEKRRERAAARRKRNAERRKRAAERRKNKARKSRPERKKVSKRDQEDRDELEDEAEGGDEEEDEGEDKEDDKDPEERDGDEGDEEGEVNEEEEPEEGGHEEGEE